MAVVNFPPRQIGPVMSEVLVLGLPDEEGRVILLQPGPTSLWAGGLLVVATGARPITFIRRSSAFIANARVSSSV